MMHTNKMILVPHEIVGENQSVSKYLSNLDSEMLKILEDKIPIDEKIVKYNQVLRMYQTAKQETEKPFRLEVKEKIPVTEKQHVEEDTTIPDEIAETLPQKSQKQAKLLLKYVKKIPNVEWSDKGEMIVNGDKITGSNIVDLINDLSRERKHVEPAVGVEILLKNLMEVNVPKELIGNKKRFEILKKNVFAAKQPKTYTSTWSSL